MRTSGFLSILKSCKSAYGKSPLLADLALKAGARKVTATPNHNQ